MKKTFKISLPAVVMYLVHSFILLEIDFMLWSQEDRAAYITFTMIAYFVCFFMAKAKW